MAPPSPPSCVPLSEWFEIAEFGLKLHQNCKNVLSIQYWLLLEPMKYIFTRKYPLRGYILGSGAPGTPGVIPKTYGTTFISDIL